MKKKSLKNQRDWQKYAERRLHRILLIVQGKPKLKRLRPRAHSWSVEVQLVGKTQMIELNGQYRGKNYATDVLSFPTLAPFQELGVLGDLVICLPTLKSQARTLGHSAELEMDVLLTHGVLHLLGFDHELSHREAKKMAQWESKILEESLPKNVMSKKILRSELGLIDRSKSGIKNE